VADTIGDPSQAAALRVSVLLAPLGSLPVGAPVGPTSRAWYDELRLAPVVAEGLRARGLDEAVAWWAAERVRLLLDLPLPSGVRGAPERVPYRLVTAWLEHPAAAPFLRVNQWDGVTWFHGESLAELLSWARRLELVADATAEPSEALAAIADASAASGFRVDSLRDALRVPGEAEAVAAETAADAADEGTVEAAAAETAAEADPAPAAAEADTARATAVDEAGEAEIGAPSPPAGAKPGKAGKPKKAKTPRADKPRKGKKKG